MKDEDFEELLESIDQARKIHRSNRINKTKPKPGKYWCFSCDRALVRKGEKCLACGNRDISKHQKP